MSIEELLKEDKDKYISELSKAASLREASDMTAREIDRLMYRFGEACKNEEEAAYAMAVMGAARSASAFIDSAGKVSTWEKNYTGPSEDNKEKRSVFFYIFASAGAVSSIAAMLLIAFDLHSTDVQFHTLAFLLFLLAGFVCVFLAGKFSVRTKEKHSEKKVRGSKNRKQNELITEIAPDADRIYHSLLGFAVTADHVIGERRTGTSAGKAAENESRPDAKELELYITLLENAYALLNSAEAGSRDPSAIKDSAGETISQIRYFLHQRGIEALEYSEENRSYFDIMPSAGKGTLRPALYCNNKLIKKGLAAGK